jgi:hypothetical protein
LVIKTPDEQLTADEIEGARRQTERLAPGFKDKSNGDYIWWAEVLRHPELKGRVIMVVSDDATKGDWILKQRDLNAGPHSNLTNDVLAAGGLELVILSTSDLLEMVQRRDPDKVSTTTLEESRDTLDQTRATWSRGAYESLLSALRSSGNADRADVIVEAARSDGFISRDKLYEIIKQDEDTRSLRQFATPARNAMSTLIHEGAVPERAQDPMRAEYTGPGKAIGHSVPDEFIDFARGDGKRSDSLIGFASVTMEDPVE